jgi:hypothetical protein
MILFRNNRVEYLNYVYRIFEFSSILITTFFSLGESYLKVCRATFNLFMEFSEKTCNIWLISRVLLHSASKYKNCLLQGN